MTTTDRQQDVVDLLLAQHRQVRSLFEEVREASGDRKRDLFQDLVRLLAVHESAEEQVVHPAARSDAGDDVVEARLREESVAKRKLAELYDMGTDHADFDRSLAQFADAVIMHAEHEELEEFPALRARETPARLRRMAGAVKAAEAMAPTRPHPGTGEGQASNLLAAGPVAMFDRTRDAVRDWRQSHDT
jgi:hemerythrin superfamily protein